MDVTKEALESVVNDFTRSLIKAKGLGIRPDQIIVCLSDDVPYDVYMVAGNPVIIKMKLQLFADALAKKNFLDFKTQLSKALERAPRMLRTLAVEPVSAVMARNADMKGWLKSKGFPKSIPPLLPLHEIKTEIFTTVRMVHRYTGEEVIIENSRLTPEQVSTRVREELSTRVHIRRESGD